MTGKQESIQLSFMIVGHMKFSPDRHFGTFKKAFRHSTVSTIDEIASVVEKSTTNKQNVPQLIQGSRGSIWLNSIIGHHILLSSID